MHMHVRSGASGDSGASGESGDSEQSGESGQSGDFNNETGNSDSVAELEEHDSLDPSQAQTSEDRTETFITDDRFDRFFAAQVLWDETMAEAIAQAYRDDPDRQIIVLAGRGHIAYNFGIPSRVQRRVIGESEDVDLIEVNPLEFEIPELENPGLDPSRQIPADPAIFVQTSVFFAQQDADRESIWPLPEGLDRQLVDYFWSF
ncbi:MAG: ChaN family lipoprotein [Coleofasciculaceae cyanobacterium RL_1_1]|nr:ChaN family lipoprotein [Coleofasciculaceae cyanobacterium RL_1_1]